MKNKRFIVSILVPLIVIISGAQVACSKEAPQKEAMMSTNQALTKAEKWMDTYDFVVGVSEGKLHGETAIYVHVSKEAVPKDAFPKTIDNFPVVVEYMGQASALKWHEPK